MHPPRRTALHNAVEDLGLFRPLREVIEIWLAPDTFRYRPAGADGFEHVCPGRIELLAAPDRGVALRSVDLVAQQLADLCQRERTSGAFKENSFRCERSHHAVERVLVRPNSGGDVAHRNRLARRHDISHSKPRDRIEGL